jgi:hypothetical protein
MAKTVSIRMGEETYAFLHKLAKEEREDLSKAVREVVYKGCAIAPGAAGHVRVGILRQVDRGRGGPTVSGCRSCCLRSCA